MSQSQRKAAPVSIGVLGTSVLGAGGVIPPGATLVFDVELLDVESSST